MADLIKQLTKKGDSTTKIYPNIKSDNIPDGAITTDKINDNAVTSDKIAPSSITRSKLVSNVISTNEIQNGAVTSDKLDNNSVTTDKIPDGAITSDKLAINAIKIYQHTLSIKFGAKSYLIILRTSDSGAYIDNGTFNPKLKNLINNMIFKADSLFYIDDSGITPQIPFKLFNLTDDTYDEFVLTVSSGTEVLWGVNSICNKTYTSSGYTIDTSFGDFVLAIDKEFE